MRYDAMHMRDFDEACKRLEHLRNDIAYALLLAQRPNITIDALAHQIDYLNDRGGQHIDRIYTSIDIWRRLHGAVRLELCEEDASHE